MYTFPDTHSWEPITYTAMKSDASNKVLRTLLF